MSDGASLSVCRYTTVPSLLERVTVKGQVDSADKNMSTVLSAQRGQQPQ